MRLTTLILLLTISIKVNGQEIPKYEQIAFDFYRDTILTMHPVKTTLTLWTELYSDISKINYPRCLDFRLTTGDSLTLNISKISHLTTGDKRFKVKRLEKGKYPRVYSTVSYCKTPNQNIVTITEIYKHYGTTYFIEMNDKGEITNWCKGGWME